MAWGTGARDRTHTARHQKQRLRILRRDQRQCQLRYADICIGIATEMDHKVNVKAGGSDDDSNMQAACHRCHARKTALEGAAASNEQRRQRAQRAKLPTRRHPGLL
ncbi:HNH endonuclease signature motif containing protein [Nocardia sp. NPDC049707]|uniref:HNH endonuclease n=1 Tax=Nocardia sp. NPDC049707 TaxID=3154735 RepID=UPI00341B5EEA